MQPRILKLAVVLVLGLTTTACATRQLSDTVSGSTAQRLATYSLERFVSRLVEEPVMNALAGQSTHLTVHFFDHHPLLDYAEQLLRQEIESRYRVSWADAQEAAPMEVDVFFNSIGTDHDNYGLSIPSLGLTGGADARISILAIDMFHGVTEGYALVRNNEKNQLARSEKLLSRVRADNVATPIIDFPINQLD